MADDTDIRPVVDLAMVADAVQVAQGKLFVLGGGWNTLLVRSFPAKHPVMAVAVLVKVPWSWAERVITIELDLEDGDGARLFPTSIRQRLTVNKPPGMPHGSDIVVPRSFTISNLVLRQPGGYSFIVSIDGRVAERVRFNAVERTA